MPMFFFTDTATTEIYTLSLHDALPIWRRPARAGGEHASEIGGRGGNIAQRDRPALAMLPRSEEHTSELQSLTNLVCRLLLEKKKTSRTRIRKRGASTKGNASRLCSAMQ